MGEPVFTGEEQLERALWSRVGAEDLAVVRDLPAAALPRFSVVIPSMNQGRFLPDALDSVLAQDYPRLEVFVSDGGSTDGSVEVLERYHRLHPDIVSFSSGPDAGQHDAVNAAIEATSGDIVAWINSDDVYLPDAFWKVAAFFHFNRCALVVYGRCAYADEQLQPRFDYGVSWSPSLREQRRRLMHHCLPAQPSLFFRREAAAIGGPLRRHRALDYDLWLRWSRDIPFYFLDEQLSLSRMHDEMQSVSGGRRLLTDICSLVHEHHQTVPRSWTATFSYFEQYGFGSWRTGETHPVTARVRRRALVRWFVLNARWSPRALRDVWRRWRALVNESANGALDRPAPPKARRPRRASP